VPGVRRVRVAHPREGLVGDVVEGDGFLAGQAVVPGHEHAGFVVQDRDVQPIGGERKPGQHRVHAVVQQRRGKGKEDLAGLGEPGALGGAVEQPRTQLLFEAADLPAQGRLGGVQGGGPAEVPVLGDNYRRAGPGTTRNSSAARQDRASDAGGAPRMGGVPYAALWGLP
jgi:hypothetical protein